MSSPLKLLLCLIALIPGKAWAQNGSPPARQYVIPGGSEKTVLQFLAPMGMGSPIADGYTLESIGIDGGVIHLGLQNAQGVAATVDLLHPTALPNAAPVGGVALRPGANTPPVVTEAIRRFLDRTFPPTSPWVLVKTGNTHPESIIHLIGRKLGEFFQWAWRTTVDLARRAGDAIRKAWSAVTHFVTETARRAWQAAADFGRRTRTAAWIVFNTVLHAVIDAAVWTGHTLWIAVTTARNWVAASLIALVVATVALIRERMKAPPPRPVLLGLAGLFGLALVLRVWLSPRSFLHEYYHLNDNWRYLFQAYDGLQYGLTGPVLFRAMNWVIGGEERSVFLANTLFAALTVPVVALFDRALFGNWTRALLAGFAVCVLPVHLRFSSSEELWIVGSLLAYGSLAAWAVWLKERSRAALAVSVLALALAMQTRPELLPLPLVHLGLLLALTPWRQWFATIFSRPVIVGLVALTALVAFRIDTVLRNRDVMTKPVWPSLWTLSVENTLTDWAVTPPALLVLAALGLAWAFVRFPKLALWLAAFAGAYVIIPLTAFANRPCIYRTQMFSMTLIGVLAAGAPLLIEMLSATTKWVTAGAAVASIAFVAGLATRHEFVSELLDQQQEYAFLSTTVPTLPEKTQLIGYFGVAVNPAQGVDWMDDFPTFLLARNHKQAERIDLIELGREVPWPAPQPDLIFYQGMDCYVSGDRSVPFAPMRKECANVRNHYELQPLQVRTLKTRGYSAASYARGPYEIGFFRVTGVRSDAAKQLAQP